MGNLLTLGVEVAASTGWEILREAGIDPAPDRAATTWAQCLRSQAEALLAADFIETVTLTGKRLYVLAVIEHAGRRVWVLGATAHPSAAWVTQTARNLLMDIDDAGCRVKHLIRDRDGKYPAVFDAVLADAGVEHDSEPARPCARPALGHPTTLLARDGRSARDGSGSAPVLGSLIETRLIIKI